MQERRAAAISGAAPSSYFAAGASKHFALGVLDLGRAQGAIGGQQVAARSRAFTARFDVAIGPCGIAEAAPAAASVPGSRPCREVLRKNAPKKSLAIVVSDVPEAHCQASIELLGEQGFLEVGRDEPAEIVREIGFDLAAVPFRRGEFGSGERAGARAPRCRRRPA